MQKIKNHEQEYLAILDNGSREGCNVLVVRIEEHEDEKQIASSFGIDLDKVEWMRGPIYIQLHI